MHFGIGIYIYTYIYFYLYLYRAPAHRSLLGKGGPFDGCGVSLFNELFMSMGKVCCEQILGLTCQEPQRTL